MALLFVLITFFTPGGMQLSYVTAFYLIFLELLLITAAVMLFSSFVSPVLAAVFTIGLFIIGHLSEDIMQFGQLMGGASQSMLSKLTYYVIPNLELFNIRGDVVHGVPVATSHVLLATLYGLCYTTLLIICAGAIFARKELK